MKVCGIICEYNPFHNGHKYQIDIIKNNLGFDAVVGIMSGNYTQRGDAAVFDKHIRANAAVLNGMDLVLELPAVHAVQSAEIFALNSVYILNALGIIDSIVFGTECDSLKVLTQIAKLLYNEPYEFKSILKNELKRGKPYFSARLNAVNSIFGKDFSEILKEPNNILAIEYIKALCTLKSSIKPYAIKRVVSHHNDERLKKGISSATSIRSELLRCGANAFDSVPDSCLELYKNAEIHNIEKLSCAVISQILKSDADAIKNVPDVSEGLENKIKKAALCSTTFEELCGKIKSKRYAHSRIRRILLNMFLGITVQDSKTLPQYIKILDFNKTGQGLLHNAKKTTALPLAKNRNGIKNNPAALEIWDRELIFDSIYKLT